MRIYLYLDKICVIMGGIFYLHIVSSAEQVPSLCLIQKSCSHFISLVSTKKCKWLIRLEYRKPLTGMITL